MNRLAKSRLRRFAFAAAFGAAFGLGVLAAPAAQAFTLESAGATNSDGSAKYVDPDQQISRFGSGGGQTTVKQGDATFHFGPAQQPFNQRYNADRMFQPNDRPAGER